MRNNLELRRLISTKVLPVLEVLRDGFRPDPVTSDLDDHQPINVSMPLGYYRRAVSVLHELKTEVLR